MKYEIIKNKIVYFKNAIPNHKEIIDCVENTSNELITDWVSWGNKYATSFEQKNSSFDFYGKGKSLYSPIFDYNKKYENYYWVYNSLSNALEICSDIYKTIMNIDESINPRLENSGFVIGKYDFNKERGLHTDCHYDDLEHSYVVYLNDDYDGGELVFPELDIEFKPEAGSIVMFKSNDVDNIHHAKKSKNGHKYIIPHFWRMGPSQGFIPWGTDINKYLEQTLDENNLVHNFEDLERVNKKERY